MECPNCKHQAASGIIKCSSCGQIFSRELLEEYNNFSFLVQWLDQNKNQIGTEKVHELIANIDLRQVELRKLMHLHDEPARLVEPTPTPPPTTSPSVTVATTPAPQPPVERQPVPSNNIPRAPAPERPAPSLPAAAPALSSQVTVPLPQVTQRQPAPPPKQASPPTPPKPAAPPTPPIDWNKVWDRAVNFVVSGALMRALLYLGAFMIVIAAAVLVIRFWNIFPDLLKYLFIFALPSAFYAAGWVLRVKVKLEQAGMVVTGIGAVLLAVDFAAVYQMMNLSISLNLYWLTASVITTAVYVFTAWRLDGEFFDYLMYIAGMNVLVSGSRVLLFPLEWTIATLPLAGAGMTAIAAFVTSRGEPWRDATHSARYLAQIITPLSLAAIVFVSSAGSETGKLSAFLFAALAYGLLAWRFPSRWQLLLSALSLAAAVSFGVLRFDAQALWLPTAGAILAAVYILSAWRVYGEKSAFVQKVQYRQILILLGYILSVYALIGGLAVFSLANKLEGAVALTLLAASFIAWAPLLQKSIHAYFAALLILVSGTLWFIMSPLTNEYHPLAYLLLVSALHLPLGILHRRVGEKFSRPYIWTSWAVAFLFFFVAIDQFTFVTGYLPALNLTFLTLYCVFNAWYFDLSPFAWAASVVLPLAIWFWSSYFALPLEQLSLVIGGLAFIYIAIERVLNWRKQHLSMRATFGAGAYILAVLGSLLGLAAYFQLSNHAAPFSLLAQALTILLLGVAARVYHTRAPLFFEPIWAALLAGLFFSVYAVNIFGLPLTSTQYGLVLSAVGWLHLLVAYILDRRPVRYAQGLYMGGYALLALAAIWNTTSRFDELWALGSLILAMLVSAALEINNLHRTWNDLTGVFNKTTSFYANLRAAFLWAAAWLFPIWCLLLLDQLQFPSVFRWLAWALPPVFYIFIGNLLGKDSPARSRPFSAAAQFFSLAALFFSAQGTLDASAQIITRHTMPQVAPAALLAHTGQAVVLSIIVLFYGLWSWQKRQRFFAHVAAWLSYLPFFAMLLLLPGMTAPIFTVAGAGWSAMLLLLGFMLDRSPTDTIRYAHGPYMAGYILLILLTAASPNLPALLWTLGTFLLVMLASTITFYGGQHRTWSDFSHLFGEEGAPSQRIAGSVFLWAIASLFPLWCWNLLTWLNVLDYFRWLALALPPLVYVFVGGWLGPKDRSRAWPFEIAGQFFTLVCLFYCYNPILSLSFNILTGQAMPVFTSVAAQFLTAHILTLLAVILFYGMWAWQKGWRLFAHIAAWLSLLPFAGLLLTLPGMTAFIFTTAFTGWAAVLLMAGYLLDSLPRPAPRHSHGPYLAGYLLAIFCLAVSIPDQRLNIVVLGLCILMALLSAITLHFKQHAAFEDLLSLIGHTETLFGRALRMLFLFFAFYALPVWVVLLQNHLGIAPAWQGAVLALLAPLYIAAGLFLGRVRRDYTWPFYSAGYALTALGAMISFADQRLAIYVLALDVVVYAVSALIFRQPFWLYAATILAPITALVALNYNDQLNLRWVGWTFTAFAFVYFGIGQLIGRRSDTPGKVDSFALPFYAPGYLLSAVALALAAGDRDLALPLFSVNLLLYAISAWRFEEPLFLYPAVTLIIVPYYLFVTRYFSISFEWQGMAWLPLILVLIGLGRFVFHRRPLDLKTPRGILSALAHPAMPFYLTGYAVSITLLLGSRWTPTALTIAAATVTILYLASALLFRHPAWLYPTLLTAHLAILSYFAIHPSDSPAAYVTLPFLALTWLEALAGYMVNRRYPVTETAESGQRVFKFMGRRFDFGAFPSAGFLTVPSWAQPIFIFVLIDTILWESLALSRLDTGFWVSAGFFLLFALFTLLWQDELLGYISLGFGLVSVGYEMSAMGYSIPQIFASLSGLGLVLYLLSWLADRIKGRLAVWHNPLVHMALGISVAALAVTLAYSYLDTIPLSLALGYAGALYLTMSLRQRTYMLGYLGMALLIFGWSLFLFMRNTSQPQLYALPAGLYFTGMGFFERQRRPGRFALIIESLGLALLLVTSFVQSTTGEGTFPYFILLMVEGLVAVWWGAARHLKVPFMIGLVASVVNILAQLVLLARISDIWRWVVILGVGILLVGLAAMVERRRALMLSRAREFRELLEKWN